MRFYTYPDMTKPSTLTADNVGILYSFWLRSVSLRAIARMTSPQVSHSTIAQWFRKAYGQDATNPEVNSLARSLLEDYPDDPEYTQYVLDNIEALKGNDKYRSRHSLQMLTQYQTVTKEGILDYLAVDGYDPETLEAPKWDYLRLPLVMYWLGQLVDLLVNLCYTEDIVEPEVNRMNELTLDELLAIKDGLETLILGGYADDGDKDPIATAMAKVEAALTVRTVAALMEE